MSNIYKNKIMQKKNQHQLNVVRDDYDKVRHHIPEAVHMTMMKYIITVNS